MENMTYKLTDFEGPLDLLIALIEKNKINILDIPIALLCDHAPVTGGIEDIGYQDVPVVCQLPVLGIFLAVEIGLRTEDGHLLALVPECALVVAIADAGTHKTINIISVRCAADVDVRLPDIATGSSMTMLHHILALVVDFVVAGKMSMSAEEFISSLKLLQQREQEREAGRGIMPLLIDIGQRLRLAERRIAEGKRNMIAEHHLLILGRKGQILFQPFHLALTQFSWRIIGHAAMEEAVVDAATRHLLFHPHFLHWFPLWKNHVSNGQRYCLYKFQKSSGNQ